MWFDTNWLARRAAIFLVAFSVIVGAIVLAAVLSVRGCRKAACRRDGKLSAAMKRGEVRKSRQGEVATLQEAVAASAALRKFEEAGTRVLEARRRKRYTLKLDLDAELPVDAEPCAPRQLMVL